MLFELANVRFVEEDDFLALRDFNASRMTKTANSTTLHVRNKVFQ
jgi:hypothetical protein